MLAYPWLRAGLAVGLQFEPTILRSALALSWEAYCLLSLLKLVLKVDFGRMCCPQQCWFLLFWEFEFALCWGGRWIGESCWHLFDAIFSQLRKFWDRFCG